MYLCLFVIIIIIIIIIIKAELMIIKSVRTLSKQQYLFP